MLSPSADLKVLLIQSAGDATLYVPLEEGPGGLFPVRMMQPDVLRLREEIAAGATLIIVDALTLGTAVCRQVLDELSAGAHDIMLIAWVGRKADGDLVGAPGVVVIRRPTDFRKRYEQMAKMIAAGLLADREELQRLATESFEK